MKLQKLGPWGMAAICLTAGCLVGDDGERCSPGQKLDEYQACVCMDNHVPIIRNVGVLVPSEMTQTLTDGCRACPEHSVAMAGECICNSGFVNTGDVCSPACVSDAQCTGDNAKCAVFPTLTGTVTSLMGYCTKSCSQTTDCNTDVGFVCTSTITNMDHVLGMLAPPNFSSRFCRRPPVGQGATCELNPLNPIEGCMSIGLEAQICTGAPFGCAAICVPGVVGCAPGEECCEVEGAGNLCFTGGCP